MWNWINCYLSGRHEFGVWCKTGEIYLRCVHCGRRSQGFTVGAHAAHALPQPPRATVRPLATASTVRRVATATLLPFSRPNARG